MPAQLIGGWWSRSASPSGQRLWPGSDVAGSDSLRIAALHSDGYTCRADVDWDSLNDCGPTSRTGMADEAQCWLDERSARKRASRSMLLFVRI